MQTKRPILHLIVSIKNQPYTLGTLRFNKGEFSYFFTYPGDSPQDHFNCDSKELTPRLDHITWHKNRVHIKRRDGVAVDPIYYEGGPLLAHPPRITPLFVESVYLGSDPCLIKNEEFPLWDGSQAQELLHLDSSSGFSMIFILMPSQTPAHVLVGLQFKDIPKGHLYSPCLADLLDQNHKPVRIQVWEDWDLIVMTTRFLRTLSSPIPHEIGGNFRLPDYKKPPAALTDLLLQSLQR